MSKSEGHSPAGARERALDLMLRHAEARERPEKKSRLFHHLKIPFAKKQACTCNFNVPFVALIVSSGRKNLPFCFFSPQDGENSRFFHFPS